MSNSLISKLHQSLIHDGLISTISRALRSSRNRLHQMYFQKRILSLQSNEERFTWIYKNNYWADDESASGSGSTLQYTDNLRKELPELFNNYGVQTIFDAPCGDFNWMRYLLPNVKIKYIGGDIVRPLVEKLNKNYKSDDVSFVHFDLINDIPPKVDLMICRDCLFHLSYKDTKQVLENFLKSDTKYLLTTTHNNLDSSFRNIDIVNGDFRLIDLYRHPYNFPNEPLAIIEDWVPPAQERSMCLWSREQIESGVNNFQI